jgi:hypothetical protein
VNGVRTNIGSYVCKPGDVIEVREKSKQLVVVLESVQLAERDVPEYVEVDHNKMTANLSSAFRVWRRALRGSDGAKPGRRILFALEKGGLQRPPFLFAGVLSLTNPGCAWVIGLIRSGLEPGVGGPPHKQRKPCP